MEPLMKDLVPGIAAHLDEDGNLTLTEVQATLDTFDEENGVEVTTITLPAQGVRALLNFLRREAVRDRIGYRKWQRENTSHK